VAAPPLEGMYDPAEYEHLNVSVSFCHPIHTHRFEKRYFSCMLIVHLNGTTAIRRTPVRRTTVRRTPVRRIGGNGHFVEPQFVEVLQHRTPVRQTPVCRNFTTSNPSSSNLQTCPKRTPKRMPKRTPKCQKFFRQIRKLIVGYVDM
jgi:hypothetical protein